MYKYFVVNSITFTHTHIDNIDLKLAIGGFNAFRGTLKYDTSEYGNLTVKQVYEASYIREF